ncbi:ABC transporter permease [Paenibacillus sp. B2(2019)]|uniref:ABC transporter permease n=1 Tax=Paenibacillus sp. B2(2019) TaxID=2607754 RepID=UPI0011F0B21B|nr:ABC transporter permease [Paenibacillus sp. B2(2019)]KAA1186838.1 ABC transporter permease [Paenibacillus sp. B2(2019)]
MRKEPYIKRIKNICSLTKSLAINDFKSKYAGSYFGLLWALLMPLVTILVYWFVFEKGLKVSAPADLNAPFVLWFVSGIIPWFYFSEALTTATHSFLEYNYLVKKVVFRIELLPLVKIFSAFLVHLFFIIILFSFFISYGYPISFFSVQIIYYTLCNIILISSISWLTAAITPFFKDFSYVLSIILQFGMWLTPILWSVDVLSPHMIFLFKLNPFYYIVEGFRDSMINKIWFYEKYKLTLYFAFVVIVNFAISIKVFRKLKPHLSDVL